jgi:hypothetical protein
LKSLCDIAIARFKQSVEENQPDEDIFEDTEFPHWNEITQKVKSKPCVNKKQQGLKINLNLGEMRLEQELLEPSKNIHHTN